MKFSLTIILILFLNMRSFQQVVAVSNDKMNVLYKGIDNPLTIAVENYSCSKIITKINCGKLIRDHDSCHYTFQADSLCVGVVKIQVGVVDSGKSKWLGTEWFRMKRIPDPVAMIAGQTRGPISKTLLLSQVAIIPILMNFDFELYFAVKTYSFEIVRNDSVIYKNEKIKGNRFTPEIINEIKKTKTNDKVKFYDITIIGLEKEDRIINEIKFTIE